MGRSVTVGFQLVGVLSLFILGYLIYSLMYPEKF